MNVTLLLKIVLLTTTFFLQAIDQAISYGYLINNQSTQKRTTIPIALPNLLITMQNYKGNTINSYLFTTNSDFKTTPAILTVQLFTPSNSVNSDTGAITTLNAQNSYAIVYTLQSPDGLFLQKEIQYPATSAASTFMPILNGYPTIPITIKIYKYTSATSQTLLNTTQIMESFAGLSNGIQQQLVNSVSPITLKFLLATNNLGLSPTVTTMSATYDPNTNITTPAVMTSLIPATVETTIPVADTTFVADDPFNSDTAVIAPITITLYNDDEAYDITFTPSLLAFTNVELLNGLIMELFIYPPLYQNAVSSNTFIFVATLQTVDGLKFQKIVNQAIPFTTYPITFTITTTSLEGNLTTFTQNFASSTITTPLYNMISPVHLRFRLQQTDENTIVISIE